MDSGSYSAIVPPTGLNLDNYFPAKYSYDSVIYVHKKFLPEYKNKHQKKHAASQIQGTLDKCQQFDSENLKANACKVKHTVKNNRNKDPLIEQTIQFAKTIIPLTIPPSTNVSPHPEYTIKTIKKSRKKTTHFKQKNEPAKDVTYDKGKHKNDYDNFKRDKFKRNRDSISARETVSSSQNNTLDDINENRTLSYTLSEMSEQKHHKEDRHCKRNKRNEMQKVAVSESFEAVATEFMNTSDTKIKIHLMNERDKNLFCENIQTPVIGTLKECIVELNKEHLKALNYMQTSIEHQTKRIRIIMNKLTSFEDKLDLYMRDRSTTNTAASKLTKPSRLEELSADILQVKGINSSDEEELGEIDLLNKSVKDNCVEIKLKDKNVSDSGKKIENLGCGEDVPVQLTAQLRIKPDKPNRVPARFCWTDAGRTN